MSIPLILITFSVTFSTILFWFLFVRWEDKSEPEPKKLIRRCFFFGIGSALIAGPIHDLVSEVFNLPLDVFGTASSSLVIINLFLAGPIEESAKYIFLRYGVYFRTEFNQVFDGVVYGVMVGLGFSFIENILYIFLLNSQNQGNIFLISTVVFRAIYTTLVHVLSTGIIGYFMGRAKFSAKNRILLIILGLIIGALVHGSFNALSMFGDYGMLASILMLIIILSIFIRQWNKVDSRMVWRYVPGKSNQ